jgi:hypothetical protein
MSNKVKVCGIVGGGGLGADVLGLSGFMKDSY